MEDSEAEPAAELARMQRLAATYARLPLGTALHTCGVCTEVGPKAAVYSTLLQSHGMLLLR